MLAMTVACGETREGASPTGSSATATEGNATGDLKSFGREGAVQIHDIVWQARATANAQMIVTSAGNVVFDTGLPTEGGLAKHLKAVDAAPVTHLILSHAHADHYGAADDFIEDGTEVIAHAEFPHNQAYLKALAPTLMPRNRIFFPDDIPALPAALLAPFYPVVEPTRLVHDKYAFEQGGIRFEVLAMPGAEGSDGLVMWLPEQRILFTGDFYGHIFPMWPNLTTIRGERIRFALPYVESIDRILALDPVLMVGSHFEPVVGGAIREGLTRIRDAVLYVHEEVIEGINDGKTVHELMREIRLPEHLRVPEVHGKVSWGVRSIYESYLGWFHLTSTTDLYDVPARDVYPEVVALAGGPTAFVRRAREHVQQGEPERALHLVEMALAAEPGNRMALEARLAALELLLERSRGVNHYEAGYLRHRIHETRDEL
jgi:alkyl sulfatase BDS1-like metallo-beta-lactamase superfamily hydrolase